MRTLYALGVGKWKRKGSVPSPKEIKAIREGLGLTQAQAAAEVMVTLRTWQYWEAGTRIPTPQAAVLIRMLRQKKS